MRADRRLYLDRTQSKLVDEASPESAWFLAGPGHEIPADMVKRLGLVVHGGRVMQQSAIPVDPPAVMPEPAVETTPEPPAAPASEPMPLSHPMPADTDSEIGKGPAPIMPPQSRRSRRKY